MQQAFRKTRGLDPNQVMSSFTAGDHPRTFSVLLVDKAHRLNRRASQLSGPLNKKFAHITRTLFGADDVSKTQLDWIAAKSRVPILLLDEQQSVMPTDLDRESVRAAIAEARKKAPTSSCRHRCVSEADGTTSTTSARC